MRIIHHVRIAEIAAQTSVAGDIDVYLGPKIIQFLTELQGQALYLVHFGQVVLPYGASSTFAITLATDVLKSLVEHPGAEGCRELPMDIKEE